MSQTKPKALVIYGDGINCEDETAYALDLAGFASTKVHCVDILESPARLETAQMLAIPGGFSFGDEIASGRVLAIKLKEKLQDALREFVDKGNLVMGICNGFQILVQLAILPDSKADARRSVSLCHNSGGKFINKWVKLEVAQGASRFLQGLSCIHLPIRHGEGRLTLALDSSDELEEKVKGQAPLRYSADVNGSYDRIAALTNKTGNVMGLMPHPEAFVRWNQHPAWDDFPAGMNESASGNGTANQLLLSPDRLRQTPHGLQIFKNAAAMLN
jgi:phosphoribosylformylglycinamidine synthase subunit PurQ / glutaminase